VVEEDNSLVLSGLFLLPFDRLPLTTDGGRCFQPGAAKDVRMSPLQFFADRHDDIADVKTACFPGDLAVKNDLQQYIPEFFFQVCPVFLANGLFYFGCFRKKVREEGAMILMLVPRATCRAPEARHNADQFCETPFEWSPSGRSRGIPVRD